MRHTLPFMLLLAGCTSGQPSLAGHWLGEARVGKDVVRLEVRIDSTRPAPRATVDVSQWQIKAEQPSEVHADGQTFDLTAGTGEKRLALSGRVGRDSLAGRLLHGADSGSFTLIRVVDLAPEELRAIFGTYRTAEGRLVGISRFEEFGPTPLVMDYGGGRIGPVYPVSRTRLLVGAALVAPVFPADTVEIGRGPAGEVLGLGLRLRGGEVVLALRMGTKEEEVKFQNGPVTLGGTLTLPVTPAPHPAIVLVHGSGPESRDFLAPWARYFSGLGFAVLAYDKRGVGASTGDWKRSDFQALAGDALAGVRLLAKRPDIRRDKIGLWGISQAGWLEPLVAALAPNEIAFLVVHAGTGVTVAEQGILNVQYELRFTGVPEADIARATTYQRLSTEVFRTDKGWDRLRAAYEREKGSPGVAAPLQPDDWFVKFYRSILDFDPVPYWAKVTCPVLLLFGELDANVPPKESIPPIQRALERAGNRDVTIKTFPGANHVLLAARTGARTEYPHLNRFVPGYFEVMRQWLQDHVELPR